MNTFKRKALFTAVLAGLGAAAGTAEAVYLSPNNEGQVLVYPYYTVQSSTGGNAWNTYISVVNTTPRAKVVKVRFLEGKHSAEVLDFNLYLSPNDMWTGAVVPSSSDPAAPGHLVTADVSCTNPPIPSTGVDFRNYLYDSTYDSILGVGLDRTREGYADMIEMATLTGAAAAAVTHNSAGIPANCAAVQGSTVVLNSMEAPGGGLIGTGTLINVNSGTDSGYKAEALDAFIGAVHYTDPGFLTPNLSTADPISVVINAGGLDAAGSSTLATVYRSDWAGQSTVVAGSQATAAVFMHSSILNEYVLDNATASLTDWVITQPLKRLFVSDISATAPYTKVLVTSGACETISFTYFNREEASAAATGSDFSPLPPSAPANSLCWESTVLSVRSNDAHTNADPTSSAVLGSKNLTNVNVKGFQNGWARLTFTGTNAVGGMGSAGTSDRTAVNSATGAIAAGTLAAQTFFGLPSTGFMIRTFSNGTLTCGTASCQGNYSSIFRHSFITTIAP